MECDVRLHADVVTMETHPKWNVSDDTVKGFLYGENIMKIFYVAVSTV